MLKNRRNGDESDEVASIKNKIPADMITRSKAMRILNVSRSAIRALDGIYLHPIVIGKTAYYQQMEIDQYLATRSGESASKAFRTFIKGGGPINAVIEHEIAPDLAERLWDAYLRMRDREATTIILTLPSQATKEAWKKTHGYGEIKPEVIQRALEVAAKNPRFREFIQTLVN